MPQKIKVLAIVPNHTGVGFFRSIRPHSYLSEFYSDEFDITMIEPNEFNFQDVNFGLEYNIMHFRNNPIGNYDIWIAKIKQLQAAGVKIIQDFDDSYNIWPNLPNPSNNKNQPRNENEMAFKKYLVDDYNQRKYTTEKTIEIIKLVDHITTTTPIFRNKLLKLNKNVTVIPNAIDPREKQFQPSASKSNKLRVGLILGSSHLKDVELLRGISQLSKETLDKIQFVLCGFDLNGTTPEWDNEAMQIKQRSIKPIESVWYEYEKILTDNYSIVSSEYKNYLMQFTNMLQYPNEDNEPYIRRWTKPIETYGIHYQEIDILLVPLVNSEFNQNKSQLKVIESAFTNKAIIASHVGPYTLDLKSAIGKNGVIDETANSILIKDGAKSNDWVKAIKLLLDKPELREKIKTNLHNEITAKYNLNKTSKTRSELYKNILIEEKDSKKLIIKTDLKPVNYNSQNPLISVIVSTRKTDEEFKQMLYKTSGLKDIELLIYENNGEYSLTKIYNKGLDESKSDICVFSHDDLIADFGWGKKLLEHYQKSDYGVLGVAGSREFTETGVWWGDKNKTYGRVKHTDGIKTWMSDFSRNLGNEIQEVVVVDGVFFSVMKSRIKMNFDEKYKGFHFYDISFCIDNYMNDVKIGVHSNIIITHKSVGRTNEQWEINRKQLVEQHKEILPLEIDLEIPYIEPIIKLKKEPKLAIIIPTKNNVNELLLPCINSVEENTKYDNYKIYIADTGSNECELNKIKEYVNKSNSYSEEYQLNEIFELIEYDYYNFAKINNDVVENKIDKDTELILFCNNDIELINDSISIMVDTYLKNKKDCGTVGCRLHYENGSIQHMGMILQINQEQHVGITHKFLGWDFKNTLTSQPIIQTHGNTAAFMLINKNLFDEIGGFSEEYVECFEDVELNLQCFLKGKKNFTNSNAVCYHLESQTRGQKIDQQDAKRILNFINESEKIKQTLYRIN